MAEVNNKVIKITVDTDKAKIKIEGVEGYFRKAETAAKALNKVLDQNTQKWGRTEAALRSQITSLVDLRSKTAGTTAEYARQTKEIDRLEAELGQLTNAQTKVSKSMGSMQSSAGIAGATVSELGRTISDMPYGITAISNNISQLGSLFAILVNKTGSVTKAFKSLFATLRASPALLVLLAFQAAVAVMDSLAQRAKKVDDAFNGLHQSVGEAATELKIASKILNDSSVSLERKDSILKQVNSKYKDFNLVLDENGIATKESTRTLNSQIEALERLAKSQAIVNEVSRIYGETAILETKSGKEAADTLDKITAHFLNFGNTVQLITTAGIFGDRGNYFAKKIEELGEKTRQAALKENQKTADALIKQLEILFPPLDPKKGPAKRLQDLNLLLIKSQIEYLGSLNQLTEEGQLQILNGITGLKLEELDIQKKSALAKAKEEGRSNSELLLIQEAYENKRIALINQANKTELDIRKSFNADLKLEVMKMSDFTSEEQKDLNVLNKIFGTDVQTVENQLKEHAGKVTKGLAAYQKNREDTEKRGNEAVAKLRYEDMLAAVYAAQDLSNGVFGVMDASFQREIDLEQDKTNKINNELKERLANENLSAQERKRIQNQIATNDEELRKKQEKIEEKKFKLNKAASIANATINTYLAATDALKQPGSTFQKIAAMIAIIGSGLAQVAIIAKQKFVSSQSGLSGTGAGGSGGGGGVQAPDFNIVGQSSSNQLAAAVGGQFNQPVKAYVVSKDISTAQEMDRNIIGSASLG
jgi:hypothetical protein